MSEQVKIVEKKPIPPEAVMLQGLPDVGLVGLIATSHIISQLDLTQLAHIDSDLLPPVVVLHKGLPQSPIRIFGNKNIIALVSETAIPAKSIHILTRAIFDWSQQKKVKIMISLGGLPIQNRQNIENPKVFGVASTESSLEMLKEMGVSIMESGFMAGPQALVMRYSAERSLSAIALLAQSFYQYPDPEAAAAAIKELTKIIKLPVNTSELIEKGEEIRLKARDLMKRTQPEMTRMKKTQEYDLPLYV